MPLKITLGRHSGTTAGKVDWFHKEKEGKDTRYMCNFINGFLFLSKNWLIDSLKWNCSNVDISKKEKKKRMKIPQSGVNFPFYVIKMSTMRLKKSSIEFNLSFASVPSLMFWDKFLTHLTQEER